MTPDDYQSVLGIPPGPRPPNHYELLGLELFEADPERIVAAYRRRLAQTEQSRAVPADRLRPLAHEIVLAKTCLLTEKSKADYDRHLNLRLVGGSEIMLLDPPVVARVEKPIDAEVVESSSDDDEIQIERADDELSQQSDDQPGFDAEEEGDQFGPHPIGDFSIASIGAEKKGRAKKPKSRRLFWIVTGLEAIGVACLFVYLRNRQQAEPEPPPQFVVRPHKQPAHPMDSPPEKSRERQQRQSPQQSNDPSASAGTQEPPGPSPDEPSNELAAGSPPATLSPTEPPHATGAGTPPTSPPAGTAPVPPPAAAPADVPAAPAEVPVAPLAARAPGDWTLRFAGSREWAIDGDMLVLSADEKQAIAALSGQRVRTLRDTSTKKPLAVMQYDVEGPPSNGNVYPTGIVPGRLLPGDYRAVLTFNDHVLSRALIFDETGHCLFFAEYRNKIRTKMFCLVERGLPLAVQIWRGKDADAYWIERDQPTPQAIKQSDLPAEQAKQLTEALERLTGLEKTVRDNQTRWRGDLKKWFGQHQKALGRLNAQGRDDYLKKLFDAQHDGLDKLLGQF